MGREIINEYNPDVVSPPGETLLETLEARGMTQAELAERTGRPKKTINEIIRGKGAITPETALQLERVLGIPARFWNNYEQAYRQYLARREERERLAEASAWLRKLPVRTMTKRGWIADCDNAIDRTREVLNFFGIASPEQWKSLWQKPSAVYRHSPVFESDPYAVSAWLRRGEILAREIECMQFDAEAFKAALQRIRSLTVAPFSPAHEEAVRLCAEAGVALVVVPSLPKIRISGATRWLTSKRALIQLSDRYKTDDQFWFTFFHEAGHILLHGKKDVFLEDHDGNGKKEQEANRFAANILIPPERYRSFRESPEARSTKAITAFAEEIGVAPGIVVGRLQHDGVVPYGSCNRLKRRINI